MTCDENNKGAIQAVAKAIRLAVNGSGAESEYLAIVTIQAYNKWREKNAPIALVVASYEDVQ